MPENPERQSGVLLQEPQTKPEPSPPNHTILVVDDDRGLSALMKRHLVRDGFRVHNLHSGQEVLTWLQTNHPILMVVDYLLPDMNGKELILELKQKGLMLPFITVTGQGDERLAVEMVKLGASDYLVKDQIMLDMLPSVVRNTIKQLEQKQQLEESEKSRRDSEARYRGIFNASMEPIVILDMNGQIADANPRACELTEYEANSMRQLSFKQLLPPAETGFWNKLLWEVSEKNAFNGETLLMTRSQAIIDIEVSASCLGLGDAEGHLLMFVRDIRQRKWAEEELKLTNEQLRISEQALSEREGRLRSIFQGSAIGIALLDMQGRAVECNEYLHELLGYEHGELRNQDFIELNHPDDREQTRQFFQELVSGARKRFQVEKRFRNRNNESIWVRVTASRVRSEERGMDYIIKIIENIHDRKIAEESLRASEWKYHLLFDNMQNAFIYNKALVNDENAIVDYLFIEANEAFETLFGIPRQQIIGKTASQLPPELIQTLLGWIDTYGKTALDGKNVRFEHHDPQTNRWFSVSVYSPQPDYFATLIEDITSRHRLQEELQDFTVRIETTNHELECTLKAVSRQLREPLQKINQAIENLSGEPVRHPAGYQPLEKQTDHLRQFLEDLECYANSYGHSEPFTHVDLARLALEALSRREQELHGLDAQVEVGQLPTVWGSPAMLEIVFTKLIDNALKFRSADRPLRIHIDARAHQDLWQIAFKDNGIGLAPHYHEQAFELFQRLHDPVRYPGNGFGLATCKRIIELHGGATAIQSQAENGFTLTFTLPGKRDNNA